MTDADFLIDWLLCARSDGAVLQCIIKLAIPNDQIKYFSLSRPKDARPNDIEKMIQLISRRNLYNWTKSVLIVSRRKYT